MPRDISPSTMSPINENCVENFKSISGRIKKQSIYFNIFLVSTFLAKNIVFSLAIVDSANTVISSCIAKRNL